MARARRAAAKPLTLGFAGSGQLDAKLIGPLLDDYTEGREVAALYVPVTDDDYTDELAEVVAWANQNGIPYTTISDEDASKQSDLKKVIAGGADDYDAGEGVGKTLVELLAGDEEQPVEDGRLLLFMDGEQEGDVALFEEAHDLEVPAFDMCNALKPITFEDEADDRPAEEEPEEEPTAAEEKPSRRRRPAAVEEEEPAAPAASRAALQDKSLVELKKLAKAMDPQTWTTDSLRGKKKEELLDILAGEQADEEAAEEPDEAQATSRPRRTRSVAPATASEAVDAPAAAEEGEDDEAETREAVFARLRGQREASERIARQLVRALKSLGDEAEEGQEFEAAAAACAAGLMVFADFIVAEVRKPKSPGRPRKDGTEAQPKLAVVPAQQEPKRRRRSVS